MPQVRVVLVAAAALLLGCGSPAGSLDGKVKGHEFSVKEAVFIDLGNEVLIAAADQENLCGVMVGAAKPGKEMNIFEGFLLNWDGNRAQPLVPGTYPQAKSASAPGLYSSSVVGWTTGCIGWGLVGPTAGKLTVESYGGPGSGSHLIATVDLSFAADRLSGRVDAVSCAFDGVVGLACSPGHLVAPPAGAPE